MTKILALANLLLIQAREEYGLNQELNMLAYEDVNNKVVAFELLYQGELIYKVSFFVEHDPSQFFCLTISQAEEVLAQFFRGKGGKTA